MLAGKKKVEPLVVYKPGDKKTTVNAYGASWDIKWYYYSFDSSYLQLQQSYTSKQNVTAIVGPFDFTKYKKMIIDFTGMTESDYHTEQTRVGYLKGSSYSSANSVDSQDFSFSRADGVNKHAEFDISNQSGNRWIYFYYIKKDETNWTRITNIRLE